MIKFEIKGLKELSKNLRKYPEISAREIQDAINSSINQVEREAKPRTPVKTGRLRAGYHQSFGLLTGKLYNRVKYAVKQHEGLYFKHTVGEAKFLENAIVHSLGQITKFFEQALENILKKIRKK